MTAAQTANQEFLDNLVDTGHLLPSGEPGIYGRGAVFQDVMNRIEDMVTQEGESEHAMRLRFPPVIPKRTLEKAGYLKSFPQLCGAVFSFSGREQAALELAESASQGRDWSGHLGMTGVVLVPAACYPAYPAIAARGRLPEAGLALDLGGSYVFRNEPSADPMRLQMFHQRELVRLGEAEEVISWRKRWMNRAARIFERLGLDVELDVASDPFFGRGGKFMASSQREQELKFEALFQGSPETPTAIASFNLHQEHFGTEFGIQLHDGRVASSACVGFGLERITMALFRTHGIAVSEWRTDVLNALWPKQGVAAS